MPIGRFVEADVVTPAIAEPPVGDLRRLRPSIVRSKVAVADVGELLAADGALRAASSACARRSHGRDLKRYVFEVSAPTGHSSVTLPVKLCRYGRPVAVAMMSCAPRSFTTSWRSSAMISSKRTQRWQTMQRSSSSTIVGPRSTAFGFADFGSATSEVPRA